MGARYLTDLAEVCRGTGFHVIEVDSWEFRARGSGGYDAPKPDHVMLHHTASPASSDGWPDVNYVTFHDDDAPLCNLYLSRDGTIYVCAAGATNTNGTGDCGHLAPDTMNSSAVGIEAGNDGVGEPWPRAQTDAYLALVAALSAAYHIPIDHVHGHWEWTSRKVDPAGPSPWAQTGSWNMGAFRADLGATPPQPPTNGDGDDELNQDQANELHAMYLATNEILGMCRELFVRWTQDAANEVHQTYINSDHTLQIVSNE